MGVEVDRDTGVGAAAIDVLEPPRPEVGMHHALAHLHAKTRLAHDAHVIVGRSLVAASRRLEQRLGT